MVFSVRFLLVVATLVAGGQHATAVTLNIEHYGAVAGDKSLQTAKQNVKAINAAFADAANFSAGVKVEVPPGKEYWALGGILGGNLHDFTFMVNGVLKALPDLKNWPLTTGHKPSYLNFLQFVNCDNLTISGGAGYTHTPNALNLTANPPSGSLIDGQGVAWWNRYVLAGGPKRPKLIHVDQSKHILVENITLLNSPNFHLLLSDVVDVEVRFVHIQVDRSEQRRLKALMGARRRLVEAGISGSENVEGLQPEDLNTDGIDPSGHDVWVHDTAINNDDDSIAVKPCNSERCTMSDCSENMLFERMTMTGFGASIGSVPATFPPNCVRNITFRNIDMPGTGKGVYIKSDPGCDRANASALIENILYENVNITKPKWWSIWIGPQQQHEPGSSLGGKCPLAYPLKKPCPTQGCVTFNNITLRNIFIDRPLLSPGVILGNQTNPMKNIVFDRVVVSEGGKWPFDSTYQCQYADIQAIGGTVPAPNCKD
jgi:polygalacturonase|eukprot:g3860.t1